jgi:hypothetical protein
LHVGAVEVVVGPVAFRGEAEFVVEKGAEVWGMVRYIKKKTLAVHRAETHQSSGRS